MPAHAPGPDGHRYRQCDEHPSEGVNDRAQPRPPPTLALDVSDKQPIDRLLTVVVEILNKTVVEIKTLGRSIESLIDVTHTHT
jgi:hypothetical protein